MEPPTLVELIKEVRISPVLLEQKCSDEHLKAISLFLDWRRVAPHLGLSKTDIEEIEGDKRTDAEKKLKTLQKWKEKYGYKSTFSNLVQVLMKLDNADHAERVCRLLRSAQIHKEETEYTSPSLAQKDDESLPNAQEGSMLLSSPDIYPALASHNVQGLSPSSFGQSANSPFEPDLIPPVSKKKCSRYLPSLPNLPDISTERCNICASMASPVSSATCLPTNTVTSPVNSFIPEETEDTSPPLPQKDDDESLPNAQEGSMPLSSPVFTIPEAMSEPLNENELCSLAKQISTNSALSIDEEQQPKDFGCGCGECSFHTFLEKGCPKPILSMSSFSYLNVDGLNHSQKQILRGRLYHEFEIISTDFASLVFRTSVSLMKQGITVQALVKLLMTLDAFQPTLPKKPLLEDRIEELQVIDTIDKVFLILRGYMSFFSYHIIECIVHEFGNPQDKERLQTYTSNLDKYSRRSVFECPTYSLTRKDQANLVVKLEGIDLEKYNAKHLEVFQYRICNIVKVSKYTLRLSSVEKGCIQVTFQMPHFVKEVIFPLSESQKAALQDEGVTRLTCGDYQCLLEETALPEPGKPIQPALDMAKQRSKAPKEITQQENSETQVVTDGAKGFGSNDNSYPFECNSPLSSSELAVSPPDTILVSHQLKPNLTSLCDTMSSDPASAAVISAAWEETMARLIITEQPEGYYRARYECEGRRGPVKGVRETHPSVQIIGKCQYGGKVQVKLVDKDGMEHASCSLEGELTKKIGPHNQMIAEFDDLRIRREKKKEGGRKEMPTKVEGRADKVAYLLFTATLNSGGPTPLTLSCLSDPIHLTAPQEPADLEWLMPESTHYSAGDYIIIKGSKMTSPKVIFRIHLPNAQTMDLLGILEKERSHQNVLMVKAPPLPQMFKHLKQEIRAYVIVTTGKSELQSKPLNFTYLPDNICPTCRQEVTPPPPYTQGPSPSH